MKDRTVTILQITGIVAGVGIFGATMYWLYLKQYDKTHPENFSVDEIPETFRKTVTTERKIIPKDFEKPAMEALVRERSEQIDYGAISTQYNSGGDRISMDTTHILKDARGGDSVREANEVRIEIEGTASPVEEQQESTIEEDEELIYEDEDGLKRMVHKSIRNAPGGKSQAELAMRFSVINDFDYNSNGSFFEKHEAYYFPDDQILAGFDGSMVEIDDPDLLDMAYMAIEVRGADQTYVRDNDAGTDYHILKRKGEYTEAYEEWVLSSED